MQWKWQEQEGRGEAHMGERVGCCRRSGARGSLNCDGLCACAEAEQGGACGHLRRYTGGRSR